MDDVAAGAVALDVTAGVAAGGGNEPCLLAGGPSERDHRLIHFNPRTSSRLTPLMAKHSSLFS